LNISLRAPSARILSLSLRREMLRCKRSMRASQNVSSVSAAPGQTKLPLGGGTIESRDYDNAYLAA
jgi:hypothetical protein